MKGARVRQWSGSRRNQRTVRDRRETRRRRDDYFAGRFIVRIVIARKPIAAVFILALRPRLDRLVGIGGIGPDEIESAPRLDRRIINRDLELCARFDQSLEHHRELAVVDREFDRVAVRAHRINFELGRVKFEPQKIVDDRSQAMGRRPAYCASAKIERQFELDMPDVGLPIARPLRLNVIGLKWTPTGDITAEGLAIAELGGKLIEKSGFVHEESS